MNLVAGDGLAGAGRQGVPDRPARPAGGADIGWPRRAAGRAARRAAGARPRAPPASRSSPASRCSRWSRPTAGSASAPTAVAAWDADAVVVAVPHQAVAARCSRRRVGAGVEPARPRSVPDRQRPPRVRPAGDRPALRRRRRVSRCSSCSTGPAPPGCAVARPVPGDLAVGGRRRGRSDRPARSSTGDDRARVGRAAAAGRGAARRRRRDRVARAGGDVPRRCPARRRPARRRRRRCPASCSPARGPPPAGRTRWRAPCAVASPRPRAEARREDASRDVTAEVPA